MIGHIKLDDKDISLYPEYKRAGLIGRVFQDPYVMVTVADMQIRMKTLPWLKDVVVKYFKVGYQERRKEVVL